MRTLKLLDEDTLTEGIEGMRRHRQFLKDERARLLALADQIEARLSAWELADAGDGWRHDRERDR